MTAAFHCSTSTISLQEKNPTNTVVSFRFPPRSIFPYVHFSASSRHSVLLPKPISPHQSFVSGAVTKQGIKAGKLAKVAAINLTFYKLCTFVWRVHQNLAGAGWHDATCGTGYHFSETNQNPVTEEAQAQLGES